MNKEVTHSLTSLSRRILSIDHFFQELFTHYSITPVFQYSNCERSELSSLTAEEDISIKKLAEIIEKSQSTVVTLLKIDKVLSGQDLALLEEVA